MLKESCARNTDLSAALERGRTSAPLTFVQDQTRVFGRALEKLQQRWGEEEVVERKF